VTPPTGGRYRLIRAVPDQAPPPDGFPILYLLDGNAAAGALTPALLRTVPDLVVIGVGYETEEPFAVRERWLDYTPPPDPKIPEARPDPTRPAYPVGGAPRFLDRLLGDLRHAAERDLPIDPTRRGLWGHSLGGLLTLYALFTAPTAFRSFYPVSPSLWWGDGVMTRLERAAVPPPVPVPRVFVMMGDREVRSGQAPPPCPRPAPATMALIDRLSAAGGLDVAALVLHGMGHRQALFASLPPALADAAVRR